MNIPKFLALSLLVLSVSSMSISGIAFSETHNISPFTIATESPLYEKGDTITITGIIKDYDRNDGIAITLTIMDPNNTLVTIAQPTVDRDAGTFSFSFVAGGTMKASGEYTVNAKYGSQPAEITFTYTGGEVVTPPPAEELVCGPDEIIVDDKCVPPPPEEPTCEAGEILVDGACIVEVTEPTCEPGEILKDGACIVEVTVPVCGAGTVLKDGQCVPEETNGGGGCLIATATFGSELAPQVQFLRELRDDTVMSTTSGASFMTGFNAIYYSFSPAIADLERENPIFKETVKIAITPLLSSLSLLSFADIDSESEMLGYGIGVILLNIGMYFVAPAVLIYKFKNRK